MKLKPKAIPISKLLSQILSNAVKFKKRHVKLIKLCKNAFYFIALICMKLISEKIVKININLQISNLNILIYIVTVNLLLNIEQNYYSIYSKIKIINSKLE